MRSRRDEFGSAEIVLVTFTNQRNLKGYRRRFADPLTVVTDPERQLYRALGFGRGSVWRVYGWRTILRYVELLREGKRMEKSTEDTLQLGGNAIVGPDGRLVWKYQGAGPDDRPSVDEILDALAELD